MPFQHQSSGRVRVKGCAGFELKKNYPAAYSVGQRVWIGRKARAGVFESVVVKRVRASVTSEPSYAGIDVAIIYTDTFNRVWVEQELVNQTTAQALVDAHRAWVRRMSQALYDGTACFPIRPEGCA